MSENREFPESAVIFHRLKVLDREMMEIKQKIEKIENEIDDVERVNATTLTEMRILIRDLEQFQKKLGTLQETITKDSGWRGFFLEFMKAAAQIAALIGAGKFIF